MADDDLHYTRQHVWIRFEDKQTVVMGITEHFAERLKDILLTELPDAGDNVLTEVALAEFETGEGFVEVFSPLDGEVLEVNTTVIDRPELLQNEPYGAGWLVKVRPDRNVPPETLLTAEEYKSYLASL